MAMRGRSWRRPTRDTGRTSRPGFDRQIVNGILWRICTGAPWRDLSAKYGKWMVVCQRFRRKSVAAVWEAIATTSGSLEPARQLGREPIISESPADVRSGAYSELKSDLA
jgi:hypothetical protein